MMREGGVGQAWVHTGRSVPRLLSAQSDGYNPVAFTALNPVYPRIVLMLNLICPWIVP